MDESDQEREKLVGVLKAIKSALLPNRVSKASILVRPVLLESDSKVWAAYEATVSWEE